MTVLGEISERELTAQLVDIAKVLGYLRYHTFRSERSPAGFPDEVLVRGSRIVFAELKSEKAQPTDNQILWLTKLAAAGGEVYLWRPSMLEGIIACLRSRERPAVGVGAWE